MTSIFPACDNHTKSPDLAVVTTPRGDHLWPPRVNRELPLMTTRPPPEPQPPYYEKLDKIYASITVATPSLLALVRPPPKPPWSFHGLLSSVLSDLASAFSFFPSLCLCFFLFKAALLLFDKKPQKGYVFWNKAARVCWQSIMTMEALEVGSHCKNFFTHPTTLKHPERMDNFETNDSRIVRTQVKEIIHNWIGKKTVDSHSYIARIRVCKRLNELMIVCCSWFGYVLLAFEQSMCMVNSVCVSFSLKYDVRQWMGNAPIQVSQSVCNACCLIY